MSAFGGLHIALNALRAQQTVQEVVGQNVANVNTPGYSRRVVRLVPVDAPAATTGVAKPGLGVKVAEIQRSASTVLNRQIQDESGTLSYWDSISAGMSQLEGVFQEPSDNGLNTLMSNFWSSWRDLSVDPTSSGSRTAVRQNGQVLADTIQRTFSDISDFARQQNSELRVQVERVNGIADEIALLNKQITQATGAGDPGNDLRDQRDQLLEELSELCQIRSADNENGSTTVVLDGHLLVGSDGATHLKVEVDSGGYQMPVWTNDEATANVQGGKLGAIITLRDWAQHDVMPELNRIASEMITAVNTLHKSGYRLDNTSAHGGDFFAGTDAHDIDISGDITANLNAIAASGTVNGAGDGSIALQIAKLQEEHLSSLGDSLTGAYSSMIGGLGLDVKNADTMANSQEGLLQFLESQRQELSGVSLDEEAVNLVSAQRAYQAAARIVTAMDEMLDRLINDTGLVGR